MKKIKITAMEAKLLHIGLNMGDPQRGVSMAEVRALSPIMDRLEASAKATELPNNQGTAFEFVDTEIALNGTEYNAVIQKLEGSSWWTNIEVARPMIKLIDKIKEAPTQEEGK